MTEKAKDLFKKKIREILDNGEEAHSELKQWGFGSQTYYVLFAVL
jgi:hypothetical protein